MPVDAELYDIAIRRLAEGIKFRVSNEEQLENWADELALKHATCIAAFIEELGE